LLLGHRTVDSKAAGVGVGPTSRRSERRILPLDDPAPGVLHIEILESSGRRSRTFIFCFKGRRPTVSRSPKVPCASRTRLASLEGWNLCYSTKGTRSGRRGSRTLKAYRSAVFETAAIAHWLALPLRAAEAGIEPARYAFNRRAQLPAVAPPQMSWRSWI
jgi:hypothetical protein